MNLRQNLSETIARLDAYPDIKTDKFSGPVANSLKKFKEKFDSAVAILEESKRWEDLKRQLIKMNSSDAQQKINGLYHSEFSALCKFLRITPKATKKLTARQAGEVKLSKKSTIFANKPTKLVREQRIETVLKISPELIDPKFKGFKVETQLVRGKSRLDLLVHTRRGAIIVEIKKAKLSYRDIDQLLGYCRKWCLHHKISIRRDAYLIGLPPKEGTELLPELSTSVFRVNIRYLGQHVPMLVQERDGGGYEKWFLGSKKKAIRLFE